MKKLLFHIACICTLFLSNIDTVLCQHWEGPIGIETSIGRIGMVGIGTENPRQLLHLYGSSNHYQLYLPPFATSEEGTKLRISNLVENVPISPSSATFTTELHNWDIRINGSNFNFDHRVANPLGTLINNRNRTVFRINEYGSATLNGSSSYYQIIGTKLGTKLRLSNLIQGAPAIVLQGSSAPPSYIDILHNWDIRANGTTFNIDYSRDNALIRTYLSINDHEQRLTFSGTIKTNILEIEGGNDIAEPFEVKDAASVTPGMVVSIDENIPGKLSISKSEYDRKVVGVVSGANGLNPGVILRLTNDEKEEEFPVALMGKVYCLAEASNGAICPGDLLTTSKKPGYAMKVLDIKKAQGAIIGKAMSPLKNGEGLVLVLVSLQ